MLIGSAVTLFIAATMIVAAFSATRQQVPGYRMVGLIMGAVAVVFAAVGIWTGIGLLKLRNWARISILVFAGFMTAMSALSGVVALSMPTTAAGVPQEFASNVRPLLAAVYAIPFGIGVWWLIQFNSRATRDAFAGLAPAGNPSPRPLSVSIIAWWNLIGGALCVVPAIIGLPTIIAGMTLRGSSARIAYLIFGAIACYLGWGLLELSERARKLAIGWFGLAALHSAYAALSPQARAAMLQLQASYDPAGSPRPASAGTAFYITMMVMTFGLIALAIWFLVRTKPAFTSTAPDAGEGSVRSDSAPLRSLE